MMKENTDLNHTIKRKGKGDKMVALLFTLLFVAFTQHINGQECSDLFTKLYSMPEKEAIDLINKINYFECRDKDGKTPIFYASGKVLLELIKKGADINARTTVPDPLAVDGEGDKGITPLIDAALRGDLEKVSLLVENGADVNAQDDYGRTALMVACEMDKIDVVKFLVERGANINLTTIANENALLYSMKSNKEKIKLLEFLLDNGIDPNSKDDKGFSALMYASMFGNYQSAKLLLERGAKVNDVNYNHGETALTIACSMPKANKELINLLLENGANLNIISKEGKTAYFYALEAGNFEIADLLEKAGADIFPHNRICKKILKDAKKKGYKTLKERT